MNPATIVAPTIPRRSSIADCASDQPTASDVLIGFGLAILLAVFVFTVVALIEKWTINRRS